MKIAIVVLAAMLAAGTVVAWPAGQGPAMGYHTVYSAQGEPEGTLFLGTFNDPLHGGVPVNGVTLDGAFLGFHIALGWTYVDYKEDERIQVLEEYADGTMTGFLIRSNPSAPPAYVVTVVEYDSHGHATWARTLYFD